MTRRVISDDVCLTGGPALAAVAALVALAGRAQAQPAWDQLGGGPERAGVASVFPSSLTPRWVRSVDAQGEAIAFAGQSGVVADRLRVYAIGRSGGVWRIHAFSAADGSPVWASPIAAPLGESWSTPALDTENGAIIVPTGSAVRGFDASTGVLRWTIATGPIINASPLLTRTRDASDRLVFTDSNVFGAGPSARLWVGNIDPFDAFDNPFQFGDVVWSAALGALAGNSPAFRDEVIYAAIQSLGPGQPGAIEARAITPAGASATLWTGSDPAADQDYFGGVSVASSAGSVGVFAATYVFNGGILNSRLAKFDAGSGALRWSVPSNRSSSTPLPLPGGYVVLSGGIDGFGTVPSVTLYRDEGAGATRVWDTALDSWVDANGNLAIDPGEYLAAGGWNTHAIAAPLGRAAGSSGPALRLYVARIAASTAAAGPELLVLDLSRMPSDPTFVIERFVGAGSTPALVDGPGAPVVYTTGAGGLFALGPIAASCYANCDGSTTAPVLNALDFACFLARFRAGEGYANCDGSTTAPVLNALDFACFLGRFRGGCP